MRVLTSKENLEGIEEKEKEKQKKVKEKTERAKAREAKKMLKEKACSGKKSAHGRNNTSAKETFTDSELSKFNRAYEEGYDIKTNERYNLWLETFHGDILNQDYSESGMSHCIT